VCWRWRRGAQAHNGEARRLCPCGDELGQWLDVDWVEAHGWHNMPKMRYPGYPPF